MITRHQISSSLSLNLVLPMYRGTIGIPQNRRLFRFATVSWRYLHSQIAVYFGLPEYHGIISPQIAVYFGLPMYHGIIGISISPFISVLPKISRHRYSSHIVGHLIIVAYDSSAIYHGYLTISVSEPSSHLHLGSVSRTICSSRPYLGSINRTISLAHHIFISVL